MFIWSQIDIGTWCWMISRINCAICLVNLDGYHKMVYIMMHAYFYFLNIILTWTCIPLLSISWLTWRGISNFIIWFWLIHVIFFLSCSCCTSMLACIVSLSDSCSQWIIDFCHCPVESVTFLGHLKFLNSSIKCVNVTFQIDYWACSSFMRQREEMINISVQENIHEKKRLTFYYCKA